MSNIPTTECTIEDYREMLRCERDNLEHQQKYSRTLENKIQKLEQQLAIAVEALWKVCDGRDSREYYSEMAEEVLQQIKELDK